MYKVGDWIEIVNNNPCVTKEKRYAIVYVDKSDARLPIKISDDKGRSEWLYESEFRKVENMTEQETRLKQAQKDRAISIEAADKEIAAIEQEIKDSEVTYSIGDRFIGEGGKWILSSCDGKETLTGLERGIAWSAPRDLGNRRAIPQDKFDIISCSGSFTRYYDARKGETV